MEQQHGVSKIKDMFLEDVAEQIQYKPVRKEIKEELEAHIEDRKMEYVELGIVEADAWNRAVKDMGDAVEIGVKLNEVRKLQMNWSTLILILSLLVIGLLGNFRLDVINEHSRIWFIMDFFHFAFGLLIFICVYYFGYQKLVKYRQIIFPILATICGLGLFERMLQNKPTSLSIIYALELLAIPAIAGILYCNRSKKV